MARALPEFVNHVAIEGVIGAGKSTLANLFAVTFRCRSVLEQFEDNPFLERFYQDAERWAFQTQLTFLASRFHQQKTIRTGSLFHETVVTDYTFEKDRIFAQVTLSGDELVLYDTLFRLMRSIASVPELTIYLRMSVDRLLKNIAKRGRAYEQAMSPEYLQSLVDAYDDHFASEQHHSTLLIIEADELDFVERKADLNLILDAVEQMEVGQSSLMVPPATE